ncbi:hypothetical protein TH63_04905 [Rufibacter radiotolerans]|uniref:Endonuclease GajA/Old nuclease/RecF-like AAA domain-containing protein n=1 Tax=Rufibacter radiotolerans TaxID=1379910 RepID=A0A0H4VID7_9BACT|nr:AAA family ATPase [Rufibacter radiotolerans]AKQ45123.1 hypothetical protein TH63_04905 [Rufibacter radiotolerans]
MAFIKSLGVENFRTFNSMVSIELESINVLTGVNNSGKSSLSKLLLLIKDSFVDNKFLQNLDFAGKSHSLGDYQNAVFEQNSSEAISILVDFPIFKTDKYKIHLKYLPKKDVKSYKAECISLVVFEKSSNVELFSLARKSFSNEKVDHYFDSIQDSFDLFINISKFTQEVQFILKKIKEKEEENANWFKRVSSSSIEYLEDPKEQYGTKFEEFDFRVEKQYVDIHLSGPQYNFGSNETMLKLKTSIEEFLNLKLKDDIKFSSIFTGYDVDSLYGPESSLKDFNTLENAIYSLSFQNIRVIRKKEVKGKVVAVLLGLLFTDAFYVIKSFFTKNLNHLPLSRGELKRLHLGDGNILDRVITDLYFHERNEGFSLPKTFILEWIRKFGIDDFNDYEIKHFPEHDVCTFALLKTTGSPYKIVKRKVLADLGFGVAQLILLLSKIATLARQQGQYYGEYRELDCTPQLLIIEEPESHFHPKWQSLLADMLIDACDRFNIQFIIETHSEYFVRRLQYHVANETVSSECIRIYYINKNGPNNTLIKYMELGYNGSFREQFESGFFDELTTLYDEIKVVQEIQAYKNEIDEFKKRYNTDITCIVLTEDAEADDNINSNLGLVLKSNGFCMDKVKIKTYHTSGDLRLAAGMIKAYEDLDNVKLIVWHLDGDFEYTKKLATVEGLIAKQGLTKTMPFVTKYNDIEGYFINEKHIKYLCPTLKISLIRSLILKAQNELQEKSLKILIKRLSDNVEPAVLLYNSNPLIYSHTKSMVKKLNNLINQHLKLKNTLAILQYSPYLLDDKLKAYSKILV